VRDRAKTNGSFKSHQIFERISANRDEIVCKFVFYVGELFAREWPKQPGTMAPFVPPFYNSSNPDVQQN
jgi:hypothetical protein